MLSSYSSSLFLSKVNLEFEASSCFMLISSFTILSFLIFSLSFYILRLIKPSCSCDICTSYLTRSWASQFPNLCDWYAHLLRKSPTGTIRLHVLNNVVTANPRNVEYMIKTRFENFPKGKPFSTILGDLLGRGIFNVDGEHWRFQKKMASTELGSVSIRSHAFDIVVSEINSRLIPLLLSACDERHEVLDLQDLFRRFSFDTICKFSFAMDPGCLESSLPISDFAAAFDLSSKLCAERAMVPSSVIWKVKRFFNVGSERKLRRAIRLIDMLAEQMIKNRRQVDFTLKNDLLSRFMCSVNDDKYLRDIVISFLLAGRDTVASALTSFLWLLSKHPEVEAKIRVESDRVMGSECLDPGSFEQLQQMHYLQAATHECMRLYPPVQFDSKFCKEDDVLPDGTFVKKGTRVTYHSYAMGRMEKIWGSDCMEFKPERWLQDGVFKQESMFKYPIFQGGYRVCLGKEMALIEIKSVVLSLIRRFDIRVAIQSETLQFIPGLTASVNGGLPVVIRRRSSTGEYRRLLIIKDQRT